MCLLMCSVTYGYVSFVWASYCSTAILSLFSSLYRLLMSLGADANAKGQFGHTPLYRVAFGEACVVKQT